MAALIFRFVNPNDRWRLHSAQRFGTAWIESPATWQRQRLSQGMPANTAGGGSMEDPSFDHFVSRRLVIRRFASADAETFASYRSDVEVARYQDWECPYPLNQAKRLIARLQHLAPGTPGTWFQFAVTLPSSGALIGDAGLGTSETEARQAELGFTFAAAHQGQGYATEAVGAVVQYAFLKLAMQRVLSRTDARNLRAQRLLERLGFRRRGEMPETTWFKGAWATDFLYSQLESEWRPWQ